MSKNRKHPAYQMLLQRLARSGVTMPGKTASYILDGQDSGGVYSAAVAVRERLCPERGWQHGLMKTLCDKGFLKWAGGNAPGRYHVYDPGPELFEVMNKQKAKTDDLVTRSEMNAALGLRDSLLKRLCKKTGVPFDPPDYEEAVKGLALQDLEDQIFTEDRAS